MTTETTQTPESTDVAASSTEKKVRQTRSDKGKKRGPRKAKV